MSRFSGKCDVYDVLIGIHEYTLEELQNNVKIYVGNNSEPLKIEKMSDLIPYYPYIVASAGFDTAGRKSTIHLSSESFVDQEEREILNIYLKQVIKIYNRCKRKKIPFEVENVIDELESWNKDVVLEIARRVQEKGKNADIEGIHLKSRDYYRRELAKEMVENGLNPAEYGYERFV